MNKFRVISIDELSGSYGASLRLGLKLEEYRVLYQNDKRMTLEDVYTIEGDQAHQLPFEQNEGQRSLAQQLGHLASMVVDMDMQPLLEVGDEINVQITGFNVRVANSGSAYLNLKGDIMPDEKRYARALKRLAAGGASQSFGQKTQAKQQPKVVKLGGGSSSSQEVTTKKPDFDPEAGF